MDMDIIHKTLRLQQNARKPLNLILRIQNHMEEPVKEQPSAAVSGSSARPKLQRYSLRSATKPKEDKPDAPDSSNSSKSKRGRTASSVSKSVGVIDFAGKDKSGSAKPPRRFSIPPKASATPGPKLAGNITPISETRTRRSAGGKGKSQTPIYEVSKTSSRMKLNLLTSASYWLNQIKLSESAAKHSISLGFFKLALEAGCEPLQQMQEGLKSYVSRHQLADLGEPVKELFETYNITQNTEQSKVSETISQVPEEGTRSSDDDVHSSSSTMGTRKLKPKCLNIEATQLTPPRESTKKETCQKSNPGSRLRGNLSTNSTNSRPALESGNRRSVKKSEKPSKQEPIEEKVRHERKSDVKEVLVSTPQGNKENMDAHNAEEISMTEVA